MFRGYNFSSADKISFDVKLPLAFFMMNAGVSHWIKKETKKRRVTNIIASANLKAFKDMNKVCESLGGGCAVVGSILI